VADISGETLAVEHALAGAGESLPDGADHTAEFARGAFANTGEFTVAVTRVMTTVEASA
jgi:isoleucyl-tRNA synthetase